MIIALFEKLVIVECPDCKNQRTLNKNSYLFLETATHRCRKCHANSVALLGGNALKEKVKGTDYYQKRGKILQKWNSEHAFIGCKLGGKACSFETHSSAGKKGGRTTADSGKLRLLACSKANTPEAQKKRFDTLKCKGLLWSSAPEEKLYELFVSHFGLNDVVHHVSKKGFRIDFYIKSIDTYVQLDGVYWHGLDKNYDQLTGTPKIKYDRDRLCDEYFLEQKMKLIRITDKEFQENGNGVIQRVK